MMSFHHVRLQLNESEITMDEVISHTELSTLCLLVRLTFNLFFLVCGADQY